MAVMPTEKDRAVRWWCHRCGASHVQGKGCPRDEEGRFARAPDAQGKPMKAADICAKAAELVGGERERTHGPKLKNHSNTAALCAAYMSIRSDPSAPIGPKEVCILNIMQKISRIESGAHNLDDWIDIAGWAGCGGEIADQLQREGQ